MLLLDNLQKYEHAYNSELARGRVSGRTQFNYAWCLIRSRYTNDQKKGVALLEELLHGGNPQVRRDYLFYLGVGYYRLKVRLKHFYSTSVKRNGSFCT